jgi:hypothetical protein
MGHSSASRVATSNACDRSLLLVTRDSLVNNVVDIVSDFSKNVSSDGYVSASRSYAQYEPEWFRDASWVAVSLARAHRFLSHDGKDDAATLALETSKRVVSNMWRTVENFLPHIAAGASTDLDDDSHKLLRHHLPARFGRDNWYFKRLIRRADGREEYIDEAREMLNKESWLKQHDSAPLLLKATAELVSEQWHSDAELPAETISTIRKALPSMSMHMAKHFVTPCANAWEEETRRLHAYSVSSMYSGIGNARALATEFGIEQVMPLQNRMDEIAKFINNTFVREGVLWAQAEELSVNPIRVTNSELIYVFSEFGVPLSESVRLNTLDMIRNTLFRRTRISDIDPVEAQILGEDFTMHILPLRYLGDRYFLGGRWLPLGAAHARYVLTEYGDRLTGINMIRYIRAKYGDGGAIRMPEQELNDTASEEDRENYLARNGGRTIEDLEWSRAEYLMLCAELAARMDTSSHTDA